MIESGLEACDATRSIVYLSIEDSKIESHEVRDEN